MAKLSPEEMIQRILSPKNKSHIDLAVLQEERLIMHCESILEKYNIPWTAWRNFTNWWQSLITREKYTRVDEMFGAPISTLSVTKDIFDQLGKFIDAQDRYVDFKFVNPDYTNDYQDFLERNNDDSFWRQRCVEALKTDICSVVVIDLPSEQNTPRPEPYKYFVSPRMFVDIDLNRYKGDVEYLLFRQDDMNWDGDLSSISANTNSKINLLRQGDTLEKIIGIDDECYRVFVKKRDVESKDWLLLSEEKHNLGYCPCIDFWQPSIKGTNGINKKGPITSVLKKLDYLLFYQALADYMDLYGPFPILVTYDTEDETFDEKNKEVNTGGIGFDPAQYNAISNAPNVAAPQTSQRNMIGPGTVREVPVPADKQDHNFMDTPMKFVGMEVESLKHVQERICQLKSEIVEICTGEDKEYLNEIAKNPEMMSASFERKETILIWIKRQVERVHRFATKAQAELRYGKEYFEGCTIDYGSDWALKDAAMLTKEFQSSVEAGMPTSYSYEIANTATKTRYKNNPEILARLAILSDIEPYPGLSLADIKLLEINKTDKLNFIIKINFNSFVKRFELENGSIVKFGSLIDYSQKIDTIKKQFISYANAIEWADTQPTGGNNTSTSSGSDAEPK